ncbi:PAS domain-containing sensor histidine kinase [Halorubrum sp. Ib24]|uniref:sensor histidine kinase n=1 Tax=unclassified Halorubrum TaxID=2642239 RepID=UPI000B98F3FD|nr:MULTISPECIES: histidine kinase N-terminal 7TM domain-containing protein [unclassified Halorubrum]OYR42322.1 PAS domain-containing sensor histidine kinase [Halorubrum sp. Ib24]OYR45466.1 PAS domain-containing sensor histidine kinase [Halorubrum sp. Hd13]OYR45687.1 PAS domain-containing sensor histidine kinase [Halorubrum sp. Ea8]OYR49789.1 PAS domain-containing sensor histidine kinase [Halorubrum sp. Eb13]
MSDLGALPVRAYLAACLLAAIIGLWLGGVAWRERDQPGGTEVALYLLCGGGISLLYAVRVASASELVMVVTLNLATPLVAAIPGIWTAFTLAFAGHDQWRTEHRIVALATPPFVWVLLAWSSATHGLSRRSLAAVAEGPFTLLSFELGLADVGFVLYAYALCVIGVLVVTDLYQRTGNRYRLQTFVILLGTLFPFLAGIATVVDLGSYANLAWFPSSLVVHGVFLYGTVFWLGTLDAAVVARDTAVEVMQDPVIVAGSDGRIRDLNPAAEELLPPDAVGSSLSAVFPRLEIGVEHPIAIDGRQFDIQEDPITDPRGTDRGHVFLLRDVTERERRQTELEHREAELERQNERLEDFAGVVSHDLRNPLAAATAAVELARHDGGENDDALDRAANAHERMDDLIEGLLSLATAGRSVDSADRVSLDATVRRVWSRLETADATLSVEGPDPTVLADGDRLEQLLSNLFRNAIEHAGANVSVRVEIERRPGGVALAVADDGPGVPPEQRSQVTERGVSLDGGTGLGLAIVVDIAEAHGWELSVEESESGGARFVIARIEPADG